MSNWRESAAEASGYEVRPDLKVGKFKDLKIQKYNGPSDFDRNRHRFGVVSQSHEGWANLDLQLNPEFLFDAVVAIAMGEEATKAAQASGDVTAQDVAKAQRIIHDLANKKLDDANTPEDNRTEALETAKRNILIQVRINVGTLWRLQEWGGQVLNQNADPASLVGIVFSGKIEEYPEGSGKLKVKDTYKIPKGYVVPVSKDTEFKTHNA